MASKSMDGGEGVMEAIRDKASATGLSLPLTWRRLVVNWEMKSRWRISLGE